MTPTITVGNIGRRVAAPRVMAIAKRSPGRFESARLQVAVERMFVADFHAEAVP